ncbi:MAG: hypothetical protein WKF96_18080 [Solirubrobacteraceae bacterium]
MTSALDGLMTLTPPPPSAEAEPDNSVPPWAEEEEPREVAPAAAPAQTIHLALGRRAMGGGYQIGEESMIDVLARRDDPDSRAAVLENMNAAWMVLAFACVVGLAISYFVTEVVFGEARNIVVAVWFGLTFFCLAGNATILYRRYYFIPDARRLAQTKGFSNVQYIGAMRRALPPNSSLVWQAAAGVLAFLIGLSIM